MKRMSVWVACLGLVLALGAPVSSAVARTSVSIDLHFGDRYRGPDLYWPDQPEVVVVPGTHVYYVADYDYDVYRCGRFWYYNYDGGWYRARSYRGPWIYVGYRSVPSEISYVPMRYRRHWRDFREGPRSGYREYGREGYRNGPDQGRYNARGRGWDHPGNQDQNGRDRQDRGQGNRQRHRGDNGD